MSILVVSVSHKSTSVAQLGELALDTPSSAKLGDQLLTSEHIDEAVHERIGDPEPLAVRLGEGEPGAEPPRVAVERGLVGLVPDRLRVLQGPGVIVLIL